MMAPAILVIAGLAATAALMLAGQPEPVMKKGKRYHIVAELTTTDNRSVLLDVLKRQVEAHGATGWKAQALGDFVTLAQYDLTAAADAPYEQETLQISKDGNRGVVRLVSLQELGGQ